MSDLIGILPEGYTWRETWFPELINNHTTLPFSSDGGHLLTLTGSMKGTTADGVHGINGVATSNINLGAIHDNEDKLWFSFRFKLDQAYAAGDGDQYLFGKWDGATDYLMCWLDTGTGKLTFGHYDLAADEEIESAETSWAADTWFHVIVSCSTAVGQRLRIDGGTAVEAVGNTTAITLTVALCLLCRDDGVSTEGVAGTMTDVRIGDDDLSSDEEEDLAKGIPPSDNVEECYLHDEGRGVVTDNRGLSGAGNDGAIDSSCTWEFGTVKQPLLDFDGSSDYTDSSAGIDISGPISLIHVIKAKSTYNTLSAADCYLLQLYVDATNEVAFWYDRVAPNAILWYVEGDGTAIDVDYTTRPTIDDYLIFVGTYDGSTASLYVNGDLIGSTGSGGAISGLVATGYFGADQAGANFDVSYMVFTGLASGCFSGQEAREVSRRINNRLGLGLTI